MIKVIYFSACEGAISYAWFIDLSVEKSDSGLPTCQCFSDMPFYIISIEWIGLS